MSFARGCALRGLPAKDFFWAVNGVNATMFMTDDLDEVLTGILAGKAHGRSVVDVRG